MTMFRSHLLPIAALLLPTQIAVAHDGPHPATQPQSYAVAGPEMSFFNTPNRQHFNLTGGDAAELGKVTVELDRQTDVLVQFSSGIATVKPEGCPCSVRASLKVNDQEPIVIKRINLGTALTTVKDAYQPDRQSADGTYVFTLPAGRHDIALIAQRVEGDSGELYVFYRNLQAIKFPRR